MQTVRKETVIATTWSGCLQVVLLASSLSFAALKETTINSCFAAYERSAFSAR